MEKDENGVTHITNPVDFVGWKIESVHRIGDHLSMVSLSRPVGKMGLRLITVVSRNIFIPAAIMRPKSKGESK